MLAGMGIGWWREFDEALPKTASAPVYHPRSEYSEQYQHFYQIYRAIYEQTRGIMRCRDTVLRELPGTM
jgi:sugar (pentulose or hexulose) kinase